MATLCSAYAPSTLKNLQTQHTLYLHFCSFFHIPPLPATAHTLCVYMQFLSRKFRDPAVIQSYVGGVKVLHIWHGYDIQPFAHVSLTLMIRGIARNKRHVPHQSLPFTPHLLHQIHQRVDFHSPLEVTIWTAMLFGFFLMCRKSNLVPDAASRFDPAKQLTRQDVTSSGDRLLVRIKWSKTIQFGRRVHSVPLLSVPGSVLCPVAAYHHMCSLVQGQGNSPLFMIPKSKGLQPLTYHMLQKTLRSWVGSTGRDPTLYSTHSLRRGGASFATEAGVSLELVKLIGDWRSDAVLQYIQFPLRSKLHAAGQMKQYLLNSGL